VSEKRDPKPSTSILHSAAPQFQIEQFMRSEVAAIPPFVDKLMVFIKKCRCVAGNEVDVEISLREALANSVVHGNHEDPRKHVTSTAVVCPMRNCPLWSRTKAPDSAAPSFLTQLP
jgi:hypothetical protein